MNPEVVAALLAILAGAAGWTLFQLWRRARFRVRAVPGVVSAHQPEALEILLRGRDDELEQLKGALRSNKLIVIGGWAGIGKTTLGRALAQQLEPTQTGIWVDCKKGMGLESLINALANFFGVEYEGFAYILKENLVKSPDLAVAALVKELDHGENVLFLDDLHLVTDRYVIHDLVRALRLSPVRARTVVLTREVNRFKEALASESALVTYAEELVLGDLDRRGSLELLRDRGLGDRPAGDLERLYHKTLGHPQGLELCAGLLLDGMSLEDIEGLPLFQRSGDEEKSLRRVFQETERRLSRDELRLLQRCSVFDEVFETRAMAAVYRAEECTAVAEKLERRFLLSPRNGHYELHPLLREYFTAGLKKDGPLVHGLAGHFYLSQAHEATKDREQAALTLKAHRHFELAHDYRQLLELFGCVFDPLETVGLWLEARRICVLTLDATRRLRDRRRESQCLGALGIICDNQGEAKQAIAYHQQALAISREVGDGRAERGHLGNLANAYAHVGQVQAAMRFYEQSLEMAVEAGDRKMQGWTLGNLALAYTNLGVPTRAADCYGQALRISRETGDRRAEVNHLGNLGMAYAHLGELEKAKDNYQESLDLAREIGDRRGQANALGNLGVAYATLGDREGAMGFYEAALQIARRIGHQRGERNQLHNLGEAWSAGANNEWALGCYLLAAEIGRAIDDPIVSQTEGKVEELKEKLGEEEFERLLERVEPNKERIVNEMLEGMARAREEGAGHVPERGGSPFPGK